MIYVVDMDIRAIIEFAEDGNSIGTPQEYIMNRISEHGVGLKDFAVIKGERLKVSISRVVILGTE